MTTYVIHARENFDPSVAATVNAHAQLDALSEQFYPGYTYDPVRRHIVYTLGFTHPGDEGGNNNTGFTIWSGNTSVSPGAPLPGGGQSCDNRYIMTLQVDNFSVTRYPAYSASSVVPNGIGGSDGTWRRFVDMPTDFTNGMQLVDPWSGDLWQHTNFGEWTGEICGIYNFRLGDNFAQTISPLAPPVSPGTDAHMEPLGMSSNWVYFLEWPPPGPSDACYLVGVPRARTEAETTADYLLAYFWFSNPFGMRDGPENDLAFAFSTNNKVYETGTPNVRNYKLYRFDEPTSAAPNNAATVGGGFTEITPWSGSTGPNTYAANYTTDNSQQGWNKLHLYYLPATDQLVHLAKFFPEDGSGLTQSDFFIDCTYISGPAGLSPTFDYHHAFVTGFMSAAWATLSSSGNTIPAGAAYAVIDYQEISPFLNASAYLYSFDYTTRWFAFTCRQVTSGTFTRPAPFTNDSFENFMVFVQYQFVSGSAPAVLQVIPETGWQTALLSNSDYTGLLTGNQVAQCIDLADTNGDYDGAEPYTSGFYDPVTQSFWWGATSFSTFAISSLYNGREASSNAPQNPSAPFLQLGLAALPTARPTSQGHIF